MSHQHSIHQDDDISSEIKNNTKNAATVPWFPRCIEDFDKFANQIISTGSIHDSHHPGYSDTKYSTRLDYFVDIANNYRSGQPVPRVEYTEEEVNTWKVVFNQMTKLYPTHACKKFNETFQVMVEKCGYREDSIPQLEDVSNFLKERTGFTLRPVAGYLSPREFLSGCAFRIFHATQYVRHSSKPFFTSDPDVCHELLGHAPLFSDPEFAQFIQEIGLASLGAPDDYIDKLNACFWFTIEVGLCREDGKIKAYGAALLSSIAELEYCLTDKPEKCEFDPEKTGLQNFPLTEFQPLYYIMESFEDAMEKMIKFANTIPRPFDLCHNKKTNCVEVIEFTDKKDER